jgi:hypothetical protein
MIKYRDKSFRNLRPFIFIVMFVFVIVGFSVGLSWGRSKRFYGKTPLKGKQKCNWDFQQKKLTLFDDPDNQRVSPYIDRRIQPSYQAKNYRKGYRNLSPEEKMMLKKRYEEWQSMPQEKRKILRNRMKKWKHLPPQEQKLFQQRYQKWQKLSPKEKEMIRERIRKWDTLSPAEKEQIRQRFYNPRYKSRP